MAFQSALAPKDERYKRNLSTCLLVIPRFQSALAPKDERYGHFRVWLRSDFRVSIRSRPEGREIQGEVYTTSAFAKFQSALAPKDERYLEVTSERGLYDVFQSALAPKDERYKQGEGIKYGMSRFQSALAPKDERYRRRHRHSSRAASFNPLSPRRTRDTLIY